MQLPGNRAAWQHFQKPPVEDWAYRAAKQLTKHHGKPAARSPLLTSPPHYRNARKRKLLLSWETQCNKTTTTTITKSPYQGGKTLQEGEGERWGVWNRTAWPELQVHWNSASKPQVWAQCGYGFPKATSCALEICLIQRLNLSRFMRRFISEPGSSPYPPTDRGWWLPKGSWLGYLHLPLRPGFIPSCAWCSRAVQRVRHYPMWQPQPELLPSSAGIAFPQTNELTEMLVANFDRKWGFFLNIVSSFGETFVVSTQVVLYVKQCIKEESAALFLLIR